MKHDVFPDLKSLADSGYLFRITDNGGASFDRYTVVTCDGDYIGLSSNPTSPQGFSQMGEGIDVQDLAESVAAGDEVDLALGDLPDGLAEHIRSRLNESLRDWATALLADPPKSRDGVEANNGTHTCLGAGIYRVPFNGWYVRVDGPAEDDRGPYRDGLTAIRMSLPYDYSLSGPEYHSTVDVARLEPCLEIARRIKKLEARVSGEDDSAGIVGPLCSIPIQKLVDDFREAADGDSGDDEIDAAYAVADTLEAIGPRYAELLAALKGLLPFIDWDTENSEERKALEAARAVITKAEGIES